MIRSTTTIHDVDRVTADLAHELDVPGSHATYVRTITVRSGNTEFKITLFATDPRLLAIREEG